MYHYYYDPASPNGCAEASGQRMIEERNGSDQVVRQHVWGLGYVDELCQVSINDDPDDEAEQDCETHYYAMQDANYNVMGLADSDGLLVERYEYTPYGQRTVFKSAGANDPLCMSPVLETQRVRLGSIDMPYGLCDIGHQGLMHDKEFGLVYNRARYLHPTLGRFMQRDPLGYMDGMSLYEYLGSGPVTGLDPYGLCSWWDHAKAFGRGVGAGLWSVPQFVGDTAHGAYDTARLGYGIAVWGITGNPDTLANTATTSRAAANGGKPDWAQRAEDVYAETGSLISASAEVAEALISVTPIVGTGYRAGQNIGDAIEYGEWTTDHTEGLGRTAGEVGVIYVVVKAGNAKLGGRAGITDKIAKQMGPRGWTKQQIAEAMKSGQQIQAVNKATGNAAIRYVHPQTGQSVVVDTVTMKSFTSADLGSGTVVRAEISHDRCHTDIHCPS